MMKPLHIVVFCFLCLSSACSKDESIDFSKESDPSALNDTTDDNVCYFEPMPYPTDADTLRILAIGNSFTEDGEQYLNDMVKSTDIDEKRLGLYDITIGSSTFDTWIEQCNKNDSCRLRKVCGSYAMKQSGRLRELLSQDWDVIVIQQASDKSYVWSTFANLKEYIDILFGQCTNKSVSIVYQLVWSHKESEMPYVLQGNIACCKKMMKRYGITTIIPTGTAIQLARQTRLNDSMYLTRDNWHLGYGMGRYIASCTWYEALFAPVFKTSITESSVTPNGVCALEDMSLAKRCAQQAVADYFDWNRQITE